MLTLLLMLAAVEAPAPATSPNAVVLVSRRSGVGRAKALEVAWQVYASLTRAGIAFKLGPTEAGDRLADVAAVRDSADCEGGRECIARLGRQLDVTVVVAVEAAEAARVYSVHVEAIVVQSGKVVATSDALARGTAIDQALAAELPRFASELAQQLTAIAEAAAAERAAAEAAEAEAAAARAPLPEPAAVTPARAAAPEAVEAQAPSEAPRSHTAAYVTGGAAIVSGLVAGGFSVWGYTQQSQLNALSSQGGKPPIEQAIALRDGANRNYSVGVAAGAAALGFAIAAIAFGLAGSGRSP
jgi:hypothetical protein